MPTHLYTDKFYSQRRENTRYSAKEILSILESEVPVTSALDVGCGTGTWLATLQERGVTRLHGIEGPWATYVQKDTNYASYTFEDLEKWSSTHVGTFDLTISLEVAEHLPESAALHFIDQLCATSSNILFSAAIPGQGGVGHKNEQWQSYWIELFARNCYVARDIIRTKIWTDERIPFWYRQNTILFREDRNITRYSDPRCFNQVHPALVETYIKRGKVAVNSKNEASFRRKILGKFYGSRTNGPGRNWHN